MMMVVALVLLEVQDRSVTSWHDAGSFHHAVTIPSQCEHCFCDPIIPSERRCP